MRKSIKVWPSVPVLAVVFTLFLVFSAIPGTPADPPVFIPFDIPGAVQTEGRGINPAGQVVGRYLGADNVWHGFLLPKGVFGLLSADVYETIHVDGADCVPRGINAAGQIVGNYAAGGKTYGFLLSKGNVTVLDVPGADTTIAVGINPDGDVVGFYIMSGTEHGFLWKQDSGFTDVDYPSATGTNARGINPDGDIVGLYWGPTPPYRVFVRSYDGTYTTKDVPGAVWPSGNAINPAGQIVGDGWRPTLGHWGFLLTEGGVSFFKVPSAGYTYPFGISPDGWIVGFYVSGGVKHGFLVHRSSLE